MQRIIALNSKTTTGKSKNLFNADIFPQIYRDAVSLARAEV